MRDEASPGGLVEALTRLLARETGHRMEAIHTTSIERVLVRLVPRRAQNGVEAELVAQRVWADPSLQRELLDAVLVSETSFFRHPDHFDEIVAEAVPRLASVRGPVRVWSAGCSTGEETYSLAACLLATLPATVAEALTVLGTDLSNRSLAAANRAEYSGRAVRDMPAVPFPVCRPTAEGKSRIDAHVRAVTRFDRHNLLEAPPPGPFHLVVCRNALLYFDDEPLARTVGHLVAALAPEGVLLTGTLDVTGVPPGLVRVGKAHVNMFVRGSAKPTARVPRSKRPSFAPGRRPTGRPRASDPVATHLLALEALERGWHRRAEQLLHDLSARCPDYLPAVFEQALLHVRAGDVGRGVHFMRELLARTEDLAPEAIVAGPEDLPVSYYRTAARALLARSGADAAGESHDAG